MIMISATGLEKTVKTAAGPLSILRGVDLKINEGEAIAIVGASGSGKTTLLSILAGLDIPTQGEVMADGVTLTKLSEDDRANWRLGRIGFVFQNFELLPSLTAIENVMLPLELCGTKDAHQKAKSLLTQFGLKERLYHFPYQMSGGEQQRVAIARAYVIRPKILFADEPTGNLDLQTGEIIMDLLFDLVGTTLLFATHNHDLTRRCQGVFELVHGKVLPQDN